MAPTATPSEATSLLCTNCEEAPRAFARKRGKRVRTKLCKRCLRERLSKPRTPRPDTPAEGDGHEPEDGRKSPNMCGARKRNGRLCEAEAGKGTDHPGYGRCKHHGGCTPTQVKGAAKQEAHAHAIVMGAPIDIDPFDALLWCVRIAAGEVSYCNIMVAHLQQGDTVGRRVQVKERPLSEGKDGESSLETVQEVTYTDPALHIWITTRRDALDRLARFSKLAVDAGVAERQVAMTERWGELLGRVIGGILDGLKLSAEQQRVAPELVRRHLTAIEGTATAREVA